MYEGFHVPSSPATLPRSLATPLPPHVKFSRSATAPDLNPIELVWDELDRKVKAKQPTSATHLWELLQQSWEELSEEYLISIVERMP